MLKNLILADLKFEYKEQNLLLEKFSIENKYIDIGFNLNSKEKLKARNYIINLLKRLNLSLTDHLNDIHELNYSRLQWQKITYSWLFRFICNYYDRYLLLKKIHKKVVVSEAVTKNFNPTPKDYSNFIDLSYSKNWNYFIILEILKNLNKNNFKLKKIKKKIINTKLISYLPQKENNFKNKAQNILSKFKNDNLFIQGIGVQKVDLIKLYLKLGFIPFKINEFEKYNYSIPKNKKKRRGLNKFKTTNEFEVILAKNILKHIPYSYYENFKELLDVSKNLNYSPKNIFTGQLHINSDLFKIWISTPEMNNKNLFIMSHGGNEFTNKSMELINELVISKKLLSIYQKKNKKTINCSRTYLTNLNFKNKKKNIILIDIERPIYNDFRIGPSSAQIVKSFNQNLNLINLIKKNKLIFKKFLLIPYKNEGYDSFKFYKKKINSSRIIKPKTALSFINLNSISICKYPFTIYLQSLLVCPTILFISGDWEFNNYFKKNKKNLEKNNMLFYDEKKLYKHLELIQANPLKWWNSEKILKIRKEILKNVPKKNSVNDIANQMKKLINV